MPATATIPALALDRKPIGHAELAELISSFSEVTARLEATHDHLRAEVARLNSELGQANEQIERTRRLAALGEMAAGIAHEVRNPLGSIRLYARMLDQDLADRPGERAIAAKIAAAATALNGIVGDVLTFAREFKITPGPTFASDLLDRAAEACSHEGVPGWGRAALLRADRGHPDGELFELRVDPGLALQAIVNVVRNAFEAVDEALRSGRPGPHAVTLDVFESESALGGGPAVPTVVFSVRDTGPGVSEEIVQRMFNPFFTTRSAGTGLGLPIVHRIVEAHGGRVVVRNNAPGEPGATVELIFPAQTRVIEDADEGNQVQRAPVVTTGRPRQLLEQSQ